MLKPEAQAFRDALCLKLQAAVHITAEHPSHRLTCCAPAAPEAPTPDAPVVQRLGL